MSDVVTIYNRALALAGARNSLSSLDQVGSEGNTCRLFYPLVRDTVQRSASWPACTAYTRLAVLGERNSEDDWDDASPSPGYRFAYAVPSDMLAPRYLHTYAPFTLEAYRSANTPAIMTNVEDAILCYTRKVESPVTWDVALQNAITLTLAATICYPLTGKAGRAETLRADAQRVVLSAQTDIANAADDIEETLPGWLTARGYEESPHMPRYFFPVQNFNGVVA